MPLYTKPELTPDQFEALKDWIEAVAYVRAGEAVHQRRPKGTVEEAEARARDALMSGDLDA